MKLIRTLTNINLNLRLQINLENITSAFMSVLIAFDFCTIIGKVLKHLFSFFLYRYYSKTGDIVSPLNNILFFQTFICNLSNKI
jgi:hypothetical protein